MTGEATIRRYGEALRAFLSARLPAREVDDAFQDCCEAILDGSSRATDAGRWAFGVARNVVFSRYRESARAKEREAGVLPGADEDGEAADPASFEESLLDALEAEERRRAFEECLSALPPRDYLALRLWLEREGDHRALAADLGCAEATARWRVHRARTLMREEARRRGYADARGKGETCRYRKPKGS